MKILLLLQLNKQFENPLGFAEYSPHKTENRAVFSEKVDFVETNKMHCCRLKYQTLYEVAKMSSAMNICNKHMNAAAILIQKYNIQ